MFCRAFLFSAILAGTAHADNPFGRPTTKVDLLITNARIWTGNAKQPRATALAVMNGRVVFVENDLGGLASPVPSVATARRLDLGGKLVVPGFYDSHVHLLGTGMRLGEVALKDAKDEEEFGRLFQGVDKEM